MRARAVREGSVGLLILIGIGLFGGLVLWLRGLNPGSQTYRITIDFENTSGMQIGTAVRYRGVAVGRILAIQPGTNQVSVLVEMTQADLRIPKEVVVESNQSGLIGETTIDITPQRLLSEAEQGLSPTAKDCDETVIICNGTTLKGNVGVSYEALLRSAEKLADLFADPEIVASLKQTLENAAVFTDKAIVLTDNLTTLTLAAQEELEPLASSVRRATDNAGDAAKEIQLTAADVRSLIAVNRFNVTNTLVNINQSSDRLLTLVDGLAGAVEDGEFIQNLEILSANAAEASANLRVASADVRVITGDVRNITGTVNTPENLLLIQQTLASARDVFQSAQKILSDVDELTGDPTLRNNLRNLINGLSNLVSSTQTLEQQTQLALLLDPLASLSQPLTVNIPQHPPTDPLTITYNQFQAQLRALAAATTPSTSAPRP